MRALTEAEARVIAVLLSARADRERDRLKIVDVPRSTYHAVRRRAYEGGWLRDRYVPHPVPLGRPMVSFLIARPFADRYDDLLRALAADPRTVLVWSATQIVLAVAFDAKATDGRKRVERIEADRLASSPTLVSVDVRGPTVPVYFDFEGLWCHVAGLDGTLAYPHGLGGGMLDAEGEPGSATLTSHQWWAMAELLRRPFSAAEQGRGGHLVGPFGLPFSQRRLLQRGWIVHRTILEPGRLPPYQGRSADQVVLLTGTPKPGARPEALFATLTRDSRVYPFVFAVGTDRWLLGALGGSTPPPADASGSRRPVLPTVREYLEGIEIVQEAAAAFTTPVDHQYDRLIPPTGATSPPKR